MHDRTSPCMGVVKTENARQIGSHSKIKAKHKVGHRLEREFTAHDEDEKGVGVADVLKWRPPCLSMV